MTIRAVIFDLGHTLWDILPDTSGALDRAYEELHATLCARLGHNALPPPAVIHSAVGDVLKATAEDYFAARRMDEPPPHTYLEIAFRRLDVNVNESILRDVCPPIFATELDRLDCAEGTLDAVRALHAEGYAIGCITNTVTSSATIREMLRRHGFDAIMRSVVVSSEEGWRKPHPSLFEKALRELGVAAGEALFVGDSPWHDIEGAQNAGMRAVLTRQYVARPTDGFAQPDATIDHVQELRDVIARFDKAAP